MSAADHDKAMAYTHSLTFFVSQALHPFKLEGHGITTPSFKELLDLSNIAKNESNELLASIHNDNPYAKAVREKFSNQVKELMKSINK
jgi:prephenate dehydrogenase